MERFSTIFFLIQKFLSIVIGDGLTKNSGWFYQNSGTDGREHKNDRKGFVW